MLRPRLDESQFGLSLPKEDTRLVRRGFASACLMVREQVLRHPYEDVEHDRVRGELRRAARTCHFGLRAECVTWAGWESHAMKTSVRMLSPNLKSFAEARPCRMPYASRCAVH
eukprot:2675532-Pleurochrysis_carterae.AAC.2